MSRRSHGSWFRPHLLTLEERLPLGDGVLGLLVGAALLPDTVPARAAVQPSASGERGVSTPRWETATGGFTPPARQDEAFAGALDDPLDATAPWHPLADHFARPSQAADGTLFPSPQREQGLDAAPLLALRAPETHAVVSRTLRPTPANASDVALLATLVGMRPSAAPPASSVTPTQEAVIKEDFGNLPISFEENVGQTDASVHYFTRGPGYGLFLTSTEAVMVLQQSGEAAPVDAHGLQPVGVPGRDRMPPAAAEHEAQEPPAVVRMQLVGANATPSVSGRAEQPGKVNYFLGNDPSKWHTNVSTFARVEYDDVYPGIDLVWHGSQQQLEYDFVVSPGADPTAIRLRFAHADRIELDAAGDLVLHAGGQELRQHAPVVYQDVGGQRQEVASRFVLEGGQVRFAVGAYDADRPLVIDPVLSYSTYLGGNGVDVGSGIAVDPATGDALVTGSTSSTDFPTANPLQASNRGGNDVFVTRLNAVGSALVFSTYLGGNNHDGGGALALDAASGDTLVTGSTRSTNFPTANPLQATHGGGLSDVFVARLNASGSALVFSTYLGGSSDELGRALAVDPATGDALVTGSTTSTNFPTASPLQGLNRGFDDVFVTRLSASGSALVFSTYLGGSDNEQGYALAVDPATGDALVTGYTSSTNFPTASPLQAFFRGFTDVFVARLSAAGSALVYATYLGGTSYDYGNGLAVDPASGDALVSGLTESPNFPTANPFQPTCSSCTRNFSDAFVSRIGAAPAAWYYVYPDSGQVTVGMPFDLYVFALDAGSFVIPDYTGTIGVFTTDPLGTPAFVYQFRRIDRGVAYFAEGMTLRTPGLQEVYVFDVATFSIWGYAAFDVRP